MALIVGARKAEVKTTTGGRSVSGLSRDLAVKDFTGEAGGSAARDRSPLRTIYIYSPDCGSKKMQGI